MSTDSLRSIRELEAAALDGHQRGQTWTAFYGQHWATGLVHVARQGTATYTATVQRLLHLLATGDTSGRLAAGDEDVDLPPAVALTPSDTATAARLQRDIFPQVTL